MGSKHSNYIKNNYWFNIATYRYQTMSQTNLQSIITRADQLIAYIKMLFLQTLHQNAFNGS